MTLLLRRCLPTLLLLAGASALLLATDRSRAKRALPAVAVLQQTSSTVLEDAVKGMIDALAAAGWRDGETVAIRRYNAEGDMAQGNAIAREIVARHGGSLRVEDGPGCRVVFELRGPGPISSGRSRTSR